MHRDLGFPQGRPRFFCASRTGFSLSGCLTQVGQALACRYCDRLKPVLVRLQVYRTSEVEVLVRVESHPVTERNCVPETGGGEHQEVNDQSVG